MDADGFTDIGLWVPNQSAVTPREAGEWYFLVSGGSALTTRIAPDPNFPPGAPGAPPSIRFTPIPFGNDIYAQFGDEFAQPIVGNFDPPIVASEIGVSQTPPNSGPIAAVIAHSMTNRDRAVLHVLQLASDPDGDPLSLISVESAQNGEIAFAADGTIEYTPAANFVGSERLSYTITDGKGGNGQGLIQIEVHSAGEFLAAVADFANTDEDIPIAIAVLANDVYGMNEALTIVSIDDALHGEISSNPDATMRYTPAANYHGSDSFGYTIRNSLGTESTARVTVTIRPKNDVPQAESFNLQVREDGATVIMPLDHALDIDGDTLVLRAVSSPNHGTVEPYSDSAVRYQPSPNFFGTDSITYEVLDGSGERASGTIEITVAPENDPPRAIDDDVRGVEDEPLNIHVLINDDDVDSTSLNITSISSPLYGTATSRDNGVIEYMPRRDFYGEDEFTYTIADENGATGIATVKLIVLPQNDPPLLELPLADSQFLDGDRIELDLGSHFTDADAIQLTYEVVGLPVGIQLDPQTGRLTGLIAKRASAYSPYQIAVFARDSDGLMADAQFIWFVNNPPPIVRDDHYDVPEDTSVVDNVSENDADPDTDFLSYEVMQSPSSGILQFDHSGGFTYIPSSNFHGEDSFVYRVTDEDDGRDVGTVTIVVAPLNDQPTMSKPFADIQKYDGELMDLALTDYFQDPDDDPLEFEVTGLPSSIQLDSFTGRLRGSLGRNASAQSPYQLTVYARDGEQLTSTATTTLFVSNPSPLPMDDEYELPEDTALTGHVGLNEIDPDGDSLSYAIILNPERGLLAFDDSGHFSYAPESDFHGTDAFTYRVTDDDGGTAEGTVMITVTEVNDNPFGTDIRVDTREDEPLELELSRYVIDADGDPLTIDTAFEPDHGTLSSNDDGTVTYMPFKDHVGSDDFSFTIIDGHGGRLSLPVHVTIEAVNDPRRSAQPRGCKVRGLERCRHVDTGGISGTREEVRSARSRREIDDLGPIRAY
jgi:hypothetical protein